MNCPKCNKEVSPEWELCPFCGYKPKKCSNPDCHLSWLPQEARFCPECGSKVRGDASSDTEKPVSKPEPTPQQPKASTVSAPVGSSNPTSPGTSTYAPRTTSPVSQNSSYNPNRSLSNSRSAWKRFGSFIGSIFLGVMGFVFVTEKEVHVDYHTGQVWETYDFFTFYHILGVVLLFFALAFFINVFTKD